MTRRVCWGLGVLAILIIGVSAFLLLQRTDTDPKLYDPYNQAAWGPVSASSHTPVELPPFEAPSFEKLIEQFKVDVAENRGDPEVLKRKQEAIANPDLLWKPGFSVPPKSTYDPELTLAQRIGNLKKDGNLMKDAVKFLRHDQTIESLRFKTYDVPGIPNGKELDFVGEVFWTTKDQEVRMAAVPRTLPQDAYEQKKYDILLEGIDAFTAAKYLVGTRWGIAYAELLLRDHPNSVVAMDFWVRSHFNKEKEMRAYEELLKKFPNAAFAYKAMAKHYLYDDDHKHAAAALFYIQKACQLDSRIAIKSPLLAECYAELGQWEASVAAYQGLSWVLTGFYGFPDALEKAQDEIYKQHHGYSGLGFPRIPVLLEIVLDEKTGKYIVVESEESK